MRKGYFVGPMFIGPKNNIHSRVIQSRNKLWVGPNAQVLSYTTEGGKGKMIKKRPIVSQYLFLGTWLPNSKSLFLLGFAFLIRVMDFSTNIKSYF